jgi:protein involved in polysaccharide export with SLBB domain
MPATEIGHVMRWLRRFSVAFAAAWLVLLLPAEASAQAEYRLDTGDKVFVTVFGHEDLSGEFEIDGSGMVSLPLVGAVKAAGNTIPEFENAVVAVLKPDYLINPRVSVQVTNYRPFYILGEVKQPGSYPYVNGMTVINAVALAGGYTYRARKEYVLISRASDKSGDKKKLPPDTVVLPGDIITVEERFF